jgi:hypothetical protein
MSISKGYFQGNLRVKYKFILFLLAFLLTAFLFTGMAKASGNFIPIHLQKGVSVEIPKNWVVLSNNSRITIDSYAQSKLADYFDLTSDYNFAANYYGDNDKTASAIFNIRYYPDETITQADSNSLTIADTKVLDDAIRTGLAKASQQFGIRVLSWMGTKKQTINGIVAFVTEYSHRSTKGGASFRVRLVRVFSANRSFTITLSYKEDQEFFLRPICDYIIMSTRM